MYVILKSTRIFKIQYDGGKYNMRVYKNYSTRDSRVSDAYQSRGSLLHYRDEYAKIL